MTNERKRELERLLSALCDGEFPVEAHAQLEVMLRDDPECRELYLQYLDMHARLLVHPGLSVARGSETERVATVPARRRLPQLLRYTAVAAATLAASLLIQAFWTSPRPEPQTKTAPMVLAAPAVYVATLTQAVNCTWESKSDARPVGARLVPGDFRLRTGIARIHFDSGPDLVVEGPAALRLESSTAALVLHGKIVFKADETAAPFDLLTPSSSLVDLGTEYAVLVGPDSEEVHVFDGEVQRTPRTNPAALEPERLGAGEARRYAGTPEAPGQPLALDPQQFTRQLGNADNVPVDPLAGLLAYEGFEYPDAGALERGTANGGLGWAGAWRPGFARPLRQGDTNLNALNVRDSLIRAGARTPSMGGSFDYTGFSKYFRKLAHPVRLDVDAVYYLSFLVRRQGPQADPLNAVEIQLRTSDELENELRGEDIDLKQRANFGVDRSNNVITHLARIGSRMPMPLSYGETYLLVVKIVASADNPDQVFVRIYGPEEPVEREEPGTWSVASPPSMTNLVFDWLEIHINSKTRQAIDEIRLGTTWTSVTAPWMAPVVASRRDKS